MCQTGGKLCIKRKTREDPAGYISNLPGVEFKGKTRLNLTIMPDKEDKSRIVSKSSTPNVMMCYFWFSKQLFEFSFSPAPQSVTTLATNHCCMIKTERILVDSALTTGCPVWLSPGYKLVRANHLTEHLDVNRTVRNTSQAGFTFDSSDSDSRLSQYFYISNFDPRLSPKHSVTSPISFSLP